MTERTAVRREAPPPANAAVGRLAVSLLAGWLALGAVHAQDDAADPAEPAPEAAPESDPGGEAAWDAADTPASDGAEAQPMAEATAPVEPSDATVAPAEAELVTVPTDAETPAPVPTDDSTQLDEITVTAQKRGQELVKDVPISISVIDDEMIFDWGLTNIREVMLFVPNVKVEEASYFMLPRIRGFSTNNNNKALEPPAGLAIDGVPYGRPEYFNAALFDVKRVEVLRGPQGTTFGKNTTAGLIHILTKEPTDEFTGFVDLQRGQFERQRLEFGVGGNVVPEFVNVRIAGLSEARRGFTENTTATLSPQADEHLGGKDNSGGRIKVDFPDLLGSHLKLTHERIELGSIGAASEFITVTDAMDAALRKYDPNFDAVPGNFIGSIDYEDFRHTRIQTTNADWAYALGTWGLAMVAGRSVMETAFSLDTDFSPAPAILGKGGDRAPTTTLELRALSPAFEGLFGLADVLGAELGSSDLLVGMFNQRVGIEGSFFDFTLPYGPYGDLTAAAESGRPENEPPLAPDLIGLAPPSEIYSNTDAADRIIQNFDQHADTRAVFGQLQWRFLTDWALQAGGRYSIERKSAHWVSDFISPEPNSILRAGGMTEFVADRNREDAFFQPKISLNWQPWGDLSLFAHWAKSFKAGGYNTFAFQAEDGQLGYGPEFTQEWGADAKGTFFNRTLKLNLSAYRMRVDQFQVLTRAPQPGVIGLGVSKVANAPAAQAQGIEGDIIWLAASWLRTYLAFGINDTEYLDFKFNECAPDRGNTDGDGETRCNATGQPFPFAPKYNGTAAFNLVSPWQPAGLEIIGGIGAEYASWAHTDIDLDPRKIQDEYWRFRANIGFGDGRAWSFKLIGENLTDEVTYIRRADLSPKQIFGFPEPPMQIYGQLRWSF